ncbi:S-adenosylmethionine decarboxylase [Desulfatibacillum aliphaticivorans]|nr:S-adenosylmethionine decarboxylase [Desulfatibacillum aliphaticivorans]
MMTKKKKRSNGGKGLGAREIFPAAEMDFDDERMSRNRRSLKFSKGLHKSSAPDEDADYADDYTDYGEGGYADAPSGPFVVNSLMEGEAVKEQVENNACWGLASAVDLYGCDPDLIRDADAIKRFVVELCDLIEMKRFGETQVVHFGEDERVAGFSMVQLIETSLISAHFANASNAVYLDVFSCKAYNPYLVRQFAVNYFKGGDSSLQVSMRR